MTRIMRPILLHFWSAPIAISEILSKDWIVTETVLAIDEDRDIPSMTVLWTDHEDTDRRLKDSKDILPDLFHGYRHGPSKEAGMWRCLESVSWADRMALQTNLISHVTNTRSHRRSPALFQEGIFIQDILLLKM